MFEDNDSMETLSEDLDSLIDSDWDDAPEAEPEEETEGQEETQDTKPEGTDPGDGEEQKQEAPEGEKQEADQPPAVPPEPEKFTLKHLDEVREVSRDEVIALAQKGMDYDRIRDRAEGYEEFLKEIAGGKAIDVMMDEVRAARIAKELGVDNATAMERVRLQKERRALESERTAASAATQEQQEAAARQQSFLDFMKEYPDVKASDIPTEVWQEVKGGARLTDAYARYEAKKLREQVKNLEAEKAALAQNAKNEERTTGSKKSTGKNETDEFDRLWYDDD